MPRTKHLDKVPAHLNNAVCCAMGYYTCGISPQKHNLCEFACVPLNELFMPMAGIIPFVALIKPDFPELIDYSELPRYVSREKILDWMQYGMDSFTAADLFDNWFNKTLAMPERKRIYPLGADWSNGRQWIEKWLGSLNFQSYFDPRARDPLTAANFINDCRYERNQPVTYSKTSLNFLKCHFQLEYEARHSAIGDAVMSALCYKRLMMKGLIGEINQQAHQQTRHTSEPTQDALPEHTE